MWKFGGRTDRGCANLEEARCWAFVGALVRERVKTKEDSLHSYSSNKVFLRRKKRKQPSLLGQRNTYMTYTSIVVLQLKKSHFQLNSFPRVFINKSIVSTSVNLGLLVKHQCSQAVAVSNLPNINNFCTTSIWKIPRAK